MVRNRQANASNARKITKEVAEQISAKFGFIVCDLKQETKLTKTGMKLLSGNVVRIHNESRHLDEICNDNK